MPQLVRNAQAHGFAFCTATGRMFFYLYKNSLINCDFSLRYEIAVSAIQKLKLFSLLKSKEGLKQATEIELPVLMRVFFKNSLIYCRFRLKLRAMRLLRKHFIAKRRFQQLPNLTIRSLLKSKEKDCMFICLGMSTIFKCVQRAIQFFLFAE